MPSIRTVAIILTGLLTAPAAHAVVISCNPTTAVPGGVATVQIALQHTADEPVAGTQNDLEYDQTVFSPVLTNPTDGSGMVPNCTLDPAITNKALSTSVIQGPPIAVRAIVVSMQNTAVIPSGNLYTCPFTVADNAALMDYTIHNDGKLVASSPEGTPLPVTSTDCVVSIVTPTPTPLCRSDADCPTGEVCVNGTCHVATPTPTPIGFCTKDQDCPTGQVCANNHCVTPTATPQCRSNADCPAGAVCANGLCVTPTPQCRSNADCPAGEVCVNGTCEGASPTPTHRKGGGSSGCGCVIDPGAPTIPPADTLAVLLPALVVLLRWRSRRASR
jgi:Cys-rich repeat protein